jgi:outer membrane protein OmpA-like peptidoglycan-associated protein
LACWCNQGGCRHNTWIFGTSVFGREIMSGIEDAGKKVAGKAKKILDSGVDGAKDVAGDAADAVGDAAGAGIDAAKGALGAVGGMLGGLAGKAGDLAGGAVDAAKGAVEGVADKAGDLADGAMDAAKGAIDGVGDAVGGIADKAGDMAGDAMDAAKGALGGAIGGVGNLAGGAADMVGGAAGKVGGAGIAAVGAGAAVLGGAAAGLGNLGKGALGGVTGAVGLGGGTSGDGGSSDGLPPMAARLDAAEARGGGGGGFLLPLIGVLGLGFLGYFGWQTIATGEGTMFQKREVAPVAAPAPVSALPAWLTGISDKLKAAFAWLTLGINGNSVIVSGEADSDAAKADALKQVKDAVSATQEGKAYSIIDNVKVKGSTATPVGAALAALGANPNVAACNTAFASTMAGRTINFSTGGASIGADNASLLDTLTAVANACKAHKIEVAGHTDSVGKPENNQALSQKRADAVKTYWTSKGVAAEGLVAKGYGETKPVEPVADETANEKNRRIDFAVTDAAAASAVPAVPAAPEAPTAPK